MDFITGVKYQFQLQNGGQFVSSSDPYTGIPATGVYFQCRDTRVPYVAGLVFPVDGSWCTCVGEKPTTFTVDGLCYTGVNRSKEAELSYIRNKLRTYYGLLHDAEVVSIQHALYCVVKNIDESGCKDIREELCQYLMLDWDDTQPDGGTEFNTLELRDTVHTILFDRQIAEFMRGIMKYRPESSISAAVGNDSRIHLYIEGRDVNKIYDAIGNQTKGNGAVSELLSKATGDIKEGFYDHAWMFMDWVSELTVANKELVQQENATAYAYAIMEDIDSLRSNFDYYSLKEIMLHVYLKIKSAMSEAQVRFMHEMYGAHGADDWRTVRERDKELYHALCNGTGEGLDVNLYNQMMLDLMRAQLTPIGEETVPDYEPSIGCVVFMGWVDALNGSNLQLAIECNSDAVLAAQKKDYEWFDGSTLSPPTANIMRTYYNKQVIPATPDWAQEFYERLYNKQSYKAWKNLMDLDKTLFEAAANCFSLTSGVYTSAILDNISNKIFTE